jgi:phosphate-selective porin OprO/OprP
MAESQAMLELLNTLKKNGTIDKKTYEKVKISMQGEDEKAKADLQAKVDAAANAKASRPASTPVHAQSAAGVAPAVVDLGAAPVAAKADHGHDAAHVKLGEKGLEIQSDDGNFKMSMGGRLQIDSQVNFQKNLRFGPLNPAMLDDGMGMRRARMHMEGTLYRDFDFKFEYDFVRGNGTNAAGITDSWVQYTRLNPFGITIGQFKEPFSLESATSNRYLTFLERSLANNAFVEFANPYKLGISGEMAQKDFTMRAAIMTEPLGGGGYANVTSTNPNGNANRNGFSGGSSWDVTGRTTYLPLNFGKDKFWHVGASGSFRGIDNTYTTANTLATSGLYPISSGMAFASQIGNVDRTNWYNTGPLTTALRSAAGAPLPGRRELDSFTRYGLETAAVYGPLSVQGEYFRTELQGFGYTSNDTLNGYYAYASYFFTGESRSYDAKKGAFGRIKPLQNFDLKGPGWGAWETAFRFDYLDMNTQHVNGGRGDNGTVAINWYLNPHVRFMADYVHVFALNTTTPNALFRNAAIQPMNNKHPDVLEFRTQLDW